MDSNKTTTTTTAATTIELYWDTSDTDGWCWRETGPGADGDTIDGAAAVSALDAMRDGVQPPAGSWAALEAEIPTGSDWYLLGAEDSEPVLVRSAEMVAGRLSSDWVSSCRVNEGPNVTLEDWIALATNASEVEIDSSGSVAVDGSWLTQAECDDLVVKIERGV